MSMAAGVLALLLMPLALGTVVVVALAGRPRGAAAWTGALGSGWVLGAVAIGLSTLLLSRPDPARVFVATLPWIAAIVLLALGVAWLHHVRAGKAVATLGSAQQAGEPPPASTRATVLWWVLFGLTAVHLLLAAWQAVLLPTVPWDAWTTWLGRAAAWWGSGAVAPMLPAADWLASTDASARATLAPHYPETVSRIALWAASAVGGWHTGTIHLLWPLLGGALACGLYGQLRRARVASTLAMAGTFACLSLPLLNAHLSLAGYADLWIAAVLLLALLHALHGWRARSTGDLLLAALLALSLPLIKLEGAVWLVCLAAVAAWAMLPWRWQWALPVAAVVLVALILPFAALPLPVPGLGVVRLSWGEVAIPAMGTLELYWRPVTTQVLASLLAFGNWHLLWYLLPAIVALRWRTVLARRELRAAAAFVVLAHGFLFVLFFFTDASAWAENLTSVNRLLLQVAPATIAWLTLLWAAPGDGAIRLQLDAGRDTA